MAGGTEVLCTVITDLQEEYFQRILPWLQHQDNLTLESVVAPRALEGEGGTYQLWQLGLNGQGWREDLVKAVAALEQGAEDSKLAGVFASTSGPLEVSHVPKFVCF